MFFPIREIQKPEAIRDSDTWRIMNCTQIDNGDTRSHIEYEISHELAEELESWQFAASEALADFESLFE